MTTKVIKMLVDETGAHEEPLEAGATYRMNAASADRWLRRRKAELVRDETKQPDSERVEDLPAERVDDADAAAAAALADAEAREAAATAAAAAQAKADAARKANTAAAADPNTGGVSRPADGGATLGKPTPAV